MYVSSAAGQPDTYEAQYNFFLGRVRDRLHVCLCFSPVGPQFARRAQQFPGLINGTTIDWFLPWPEQALVSVAAKFLDNFQMACPEPVGDLVCRCMFQSAGQHAPVHSGRVTEGKPSSPWPPSSWTISRWPAPNRCACVYSQSVCFVCKICMSGCSAQGKAPLRGRQVPIQNPDGLPRASECGIICMLKERWMGRSSGQRMTDSLGLY